MPTYDYECTNGHRFEAVQKMTDPKLEACPHCGARVERLIGPGAGIVFKGSGFYTTDYRSESYRKAAKSESGATATGETEKKTPAAPGSEHKGGGSEGTPSARGTGASAKPKPAPESGSGGGTSGPPPD